MQFNSDQLDMESCQLDFLSDESCVQESGKPIVQKALIAKRVSEKQGQGASWHLVIEIILTPEPGTENKTKIQ